jgi:hypothetical protein
MTPKLSHALVMKDRVRSASALTAGLPCSGRPELKLWTPPRMSTILFK